MEGCVASCFVQCHFVSYIGFMRLSKRAIIDKLGNMWKVAVVIYF
jgi:hypothetical protein